MLIQIHKNLKLINFFGGGHGQKWVWPVWSQDSKINFISRPSQVASWPSGHNHASNVLTNGIMRTQKFVLGIDSSV